MSADFMDVILDDAAEADLILAREIVKATLLFEEHRQCNCREEIDRGEWDKGQKIRAALYGIYVGRGRPAQPRQSVQSSDDGPFEAMIYDAHLPSMTARFRIPEGLPFATGMYEIRRVRRPTDEDQARWAHLPEPPDWSDEP